jgi:hypothetical protein
MGNCNLKKSPSFVVHCIDVGAIILDSDYHMAALMTRAETRHAFNRFAGGALNIRAFDAAIDGVADGV